MYSAFGAGVRDEKDEPSLSTTESLLKVWLCLLSGSCVLDGGWSGASGRPRRPLFQRVPAPDQQTLSEFLRRHARAINDLFTQTMEMARRAGVVRLGHVAIDSTRVQANASRRRVVDEEQAVREQRARDRRNRCGGFSNGP